MFDVTVTNANGNTFSCVEGKITTEILRDSNGKLRLEFNVPIVNVVTIWHPGDYSIPAMRLPWSLGDNKEIYEKKEYYCNDYRLL